MRPPPGRRIPEKILLLNKALYGLRRSPILWQRDLTTKLINLDFEPVPHELCCFIRGGLLVFFYVDDIVFVYKKELASQVEEVVQKLKSFYDLIGGDDLQWFLGIEVIRDRNAGLIWLSQSAYR